MRDIIKPGIILLLITAVAGVLLGAVNLVTAPLIAENEKKAKNEAMGRLLPGVKDNNFSEDTEITAGDHCLTVYNIGYDGSEPVGFIITANPNGYGGKMGLLVAISVSGEITGVEIVKHAETPGLGANAKSAAYLGQYIGKSDVLSVTKSVAGENEIEAITSATITSQAVTDGVNDAIEFFKTNLAGGAE